MTVSRKTWGHTAACRLTKSWRLQGCHSQGKLDLIQGQGKVREFLNPCSKSVKSQGIYLKVAANYFIRCFCIDDPILFKKLSEPSLFLLNHDRKSHPGGKLFYRQWKVRDLFCSSGWQPWPWFTAYIFDIGHIHVMFKLCLSKQVDSCPVSCKHIGGSGLELIKVACFFWSWAVTRYWFSIGSQARAGLMYCNQELCFKAWLNLLIKKYVC